MILKLVNVVIEIEPRAVFPDPVIPAIMEVKGCSNANNFGKAYFGVAA